MAMIFLFFFDMLIQRKNSPQGEPGAFKNYTPNQCFRKHVILFFNISRLAGRLAATDLVFPL